MTERKCAFRTTLQEPKQTFVQLSASAKMASNPPFAVQSPNAAYADSARTQKATIRCCGDRVIGRGGADTSSNLRAGIRTSFTMRVQRSPHHVKKRSTNGFPRRTKSRRSSSPSSISRANGTDSIRCQASSGAVPKNVLKAGI